MTTPEQTRRLERFYPTAPSKYAELRQTLEAHCREHGPTCRLASVPSWIGPLFEFLNQFVMGMESLEIGGSLGYGAALLADAGGPHVRVETIESDPSHATLARQLLARHNLAEKVTVREGIESEVVAALPGPYDLILLNCSWEQYPACLPYFQRLIASGGLLVTANLNDYFEQPSAENNQRASLERYLDELCAHPAFKTIILPGEWVALSVRVTL